MMADVPFLGCKISHHKGPAKQLMSFIKYVQDELTNDIDADTACKKYKDFVGDLTQSKVCRFFDANKDLEWFRLKYHPNENQEICQRNSSNLLHRLSLFNKLNESGILDQLSFDIINAQRILDIMDAMIISLESGSPEFLDQLLNPNQLEAHSDIVKLKEQFIPSRPNSVIIDDLNIDTTCSEIHELCIKADPNLLRLTALDPTYVTGGLLKRKFVAIYRHDVDIKKVFWHLSRMKLNNKPLSVSINKCLTNRIMSVESINAHPICILNDIRKAVILILNLDEYRGLQGKRKQLKDINIAHQNGSQALNNAINNASASIKMEVDNNTPNQHLGSDAENDAAPLSPPRSEKSLNEDEEDKSFDIQSLDDEREKIKRKLFEYKFNIDLSNYRLASKMAKSKNPVLDGVHSSLVDFVEAAQACYYLSKVDTELMAEPLGPDVDAFLEDKMNVIDSAVQNLNDSQEESKRLLDKMLWYLRIVHSFDFYKMALYKQEDELTFRMSVIHLRDIASNFNQIDVDLLRKHIQKTDQLFYDFGASQTQKYITKDEERFNYRSYGKIITDELRSYVQKIQKSDKNDEFEDVFKCKHCTRGFQKLSDIARHFVSKHKWAVEAIELDTDFFNAYLFDINKIEPCPPKELLEIKPNKFLISNLSKMGEDPDLLKQTMEEYRKMESFVWEPAPRATKENDPRNETLVDYTDISFDDAI